MCLHWCIPLFLSMSKVRMVNYLTRTVLSSWNICDDTYAGHRTSGKHRSPALAPQLWTIWFPWHVFLNVLTTNPAYLYLLFKNVFPIFYLFFLFAMLLRTYSNVTSLSCLRPFNAFNPKCFKDICYPLYQCRVWHTTSTLFIHDFHVIWLRLQGMKAI